MDLILNQKKEYYAVYDYGQGGVWIVFLARSPEEIISKYPFLKVPVPQPVFLGEPKRQIYRTDFQDIDEPESELLSGIREEVSRSGSGLR